MKHTTAKIMKIMFFAHTGACSNKTLMEDNPLYKIADDTNTLLRFNPGQPIIAVISCLRQPGLRLRQLVAGNDDRIDIDFSDLRAAASQIPRAHQRLSVNTRAANDSLLTINARAIEPSRGRESR